MNIIVNVYMYTIESTVVSQHLMQPYSTHIYCKYAVNYSRFYCSAVLTIYIVQYTVQNRQPTIYSVWLCIIHQKALTLLVVVLMQSPKA